MSALGRLDGGAVWLRRLILLVVVALAISGFFENGDVPRPGPDDLAPPHAEAPAPLNRRGPPGVRYVEVALAEPPVRGRIGFSAADNEAGKTYIGTAYATPVEGVWTTARHVAEECRRVMLMTARGLVTVATVVHDASADLSLLYAPTGGALEPAHDGWLPLEDDRLDGFAMGFPSGEEASVHLAYIGRIAARADHGAHRQRWAAGGLWQIKRTGLFDEPELGGISGGPLLNRSGRLLGSVIGGQPRRARAVTLDPVNLSALLAAAGETRRHTSWHPDGLEPGTAEDARRALLERGMLSLVVCRA